MSDAQEVLALLAKCESAADQIDVLQRSYGAAGNVELTLAEADNILQRLGSAGSRATQIDILERSRDERMKLVCVW